MYVTFRNAARGGPTDRVTAVGNMHKTGKDWTCCSGDMLADRQSDTRTDEHTHTHADIITILRSPTGGGLINEYRMHVTVWVRYSNCFALLIGLPEGF